MLSRKHKPVPHPQPQRNTSADWSSLAGFGGKSWNSLSMRHLLAKTSFATKMSPLLPLVLLHPTWMRCVSSPWVSEARSWSGGSPAPLHVLWPDLQTRHCVLHGTAGSLNAATKLLVSALCVGGGGENREAKGDGFGLWVCAGTAPGFVFLFCLLLVLQLLCVWLCYVWVVIAFSSR